MNQYSNIVYRLRWAILLIGLTCIATGLFWLYLGPWWFTVLLTGGGDGIFKDYDFHDPGLVIFFLGVILLAQWLFLRPRRDWRVKLAVSSTDRRNTLSLSKRWSVVNGP